MSATPVIPTTPPVPTRSPIIGSDGLVTRPWIAWFTTLGKLFGFNQSIQANGEAVTGEVSLNFLPPFIVTDNPGNGSTDISLPAATFSVQFGKAQQNPTGTDTVALDVAFPTPFDAVPVVTCSPDNTPRATGADPFGCYPTNITTAGFTANFWCAVPTGGGGATIDQQVNCNWIAIAQ